MTTWFNTLWQTLATLSLFALGGYWIGHFTLSLCIGALVCLGWQLGQLYRLQYWLIQGDWSQIPDSSGGWEELYLRIVRLRQRNRKRKRKLSKLLKQFQQAVTVLPYAIVVLNDDNQLTWSNKAAQSLLGLRPKQDNGLHITMLLRHPKFIDYLHRSDRLESVELASPLNAEIQLKIRVIPYTGKERLLIAADISQAQRLNQMRRDFVSNVSHELRTPLTVITGYLETLLDNEDTTRERWRLSGQQMYQQANRMLYLVEDLLTLSRLENDDITRGTLLPVDIPDLLRTIYADAQLLSTDTGHQLTLTIDDNLWLKGIEKELRSAISNLVFNAVRHTPPGTAIELHWFADQNGVHFEVKDYGEGIAAQHLSRLSERFYRIDKSRSRDDEYTGTGLGLAIAKHVMQRHDGELRIESGLGIGSTFACDFPLTLKIPKLTLIDNRHYARPGLA